MAGFRNKFTFKIILSYLVLGALTVLVGFFLYSEFEKLTDEKTKDAGQKKFIETGTLINLVYEADGFSRLAILTENDGDFDQYTLKTDSLFLKIKEIKSLLTSDFQIRQLDSVKTLLIEKNDNIEQLRILTLTNKKDTSLDEIMEEVQKLEASIGLISVETLLQEPSKLSRRERRVWQSYADYLNSDPARDPSTVRSKTVDSMLIAARYIVSEAKKENSRIRESLRQKEDELIQNDLNISERLREIIESFDEEIAKKNNLELQESAASIQRTGVILKFAGILGGVVILIFSYFILSDFFKAERFKKNLEESKYYAESLLKSREQLISTVGHDLKTPLNTISGYAELLENSPLSEKQRNYLSQINSSSHFITHLVDDLQDFSKLEAGKLSMEHIPFSLENIIVEAGNAVEQSNPQKPVEVRISISETLENRIFKSDPFRIRQIINNLMGNAFKFTENGSVSINAEVVKSERNISTVKIAVIDTGIGISKEKQKLIFNEFTQAEVEIAHKFGGSGLGLAISKKLTELLGGRLEVESVLGEGSCFTLWLPLENTEPITVPSNKFKKILIFNGLKGAIIEDDQAMRTLLREIFGGMGITSKTFSSFEKFRKSGFDFDFVLTDIQMPGTDGFSILEKLENGEVDFYNGQPVIAMTGNREHERNYYLKKGFAEMLPKPFSSQELIATLRRIFPEHAYISATAENELEEKPQHPYVPSKGHQPFDLALLNSFLSSPESLREVISVFDFQTKHDLKSLTLAVSKKDVKTIKEIAHRMLTMFRQLKAVEAIPILEKMELYSRKTETSELEKDLGQLQKKATELLEGLNDLEL